MDLTNSRLSVSNLTKYYGGKCALKNLSFELQQGRVLGLLGPNGSGKTTLLKLIAGLLRQKSGEILIDGVKPSCGTKGCTAFLSDSEFLYSWMKISDAKSYYADFFTDFDSSKFNELLSFMNLDETAFVKSLSKGMKEKLSLSLSLSRNARLYLLDEPLGGVDPVARDKIVSAIIKNYTENSSVIISTHLVDYVEKLFDDVLYLRNGEIALFGNAEDLREEKGKSIDEIYREVFIND